MFVGVSKNIGGFRVGVGTRIGGAKKGPTSRELKSAEFTAFMNKVQDEINTAIITFIEANGYDFATIEKEKTDLEILFQDNPKYNEFIDIFSAAKIEIEKVLFSGDNGVIAKRNITDELFKIKAFIDKNYPGFTPKAKIQSKKKVGIFLGLAILVFPLLFSWFTLRKGYSKLARITSFSWLAFIFIIAISSPGKQMDNVQQNNQATPIQQKNAANK